MRNDAPIGVFDSGVGGLTVVKELRRVLPHEQLIYVGDTARAPYGSREPREIMAFMHQNLNFLREQGVKMAVIACNTMTACGYETARAEYPFLLTAMNSGVDGAAALSRSRKIGVIATQGTVRGEMHKKAARARAARLEVYARACPDFVPLIESGVIAGPEIERAAERYLEFFRGAGIDALILGCTHYPLIEDVVRRYAGAGVQLVNPAEATAADAARQLREAALLRADGAAGALKLCFSAHLERARRLARLVLNTSGAEFRTVDLTRYAADA